MLLQGAATEGISITDDEVMQYIAEMQKSATQAHADEATAAFKSAAEAAGVTEKEFPRDRRVIAAYRKVILLARMRSLLFYRLSPSERSVPAALDSAIDRFVASHAEWVRIVPAP